MVNVYPSWDIQRKIPCLIPIIVILGLIALTLIAGCSSSDSSSKDTTPSAIITSYPPSGGILTLEATNPSSSSSEREIVADITFYDGKVKLGTKRATWPPLASGETGRTTIFIPSDAKSYKVEAVAIKIGEKLYPCYFEYIEK